MSLANDAWACGQKLTDEAKSEHGRWMGQGCRDLRLKHQIELMREAARLLKECAAELDQH